MLAASVGRKNTITEEQLLQLVGRYDLKNYRRDFFVGDGR